jgi:predicted ester cyclase
VPPTPSELVERFYNEVWNKADEDVARKILSPDFRFRASLGPELRGPGGFIAYMRTLRAALENFTCIIDEVIATQDRAAARLSFRGTHRGKFFGAEPTGRDIRWSGAAFFTIGGGTITELWVLGDIDAVKRQVMPEHPTESFTVKERLSSN